MRERPSRTPITNGDLVQAGIDTGIDVDHVSAVSALQVPSIDLGSVGIGFRLLIALGVMIGPTLLFLGLCRFLDWLRDDRTIQHVAQHEDVDGSLEPTLGDAVAGLTGGESRREVTRCQHCGAPALPEVSACLECGRSP